MNTETRQKKITNTAILGIVLNLLIASIKIILGMAVASLAIVSEGINNASDAGSSFLTLIGTKLSGRHPDEKHPFGYGRIEYLTGLVVGMLILYTGISLFRESIGGVLHPAEMQVSILAIAMVALSAVIKFFLGLYTIRVGTSVNSDALIAVGEDCRNDSFFSVLTIAASILYLIKGFSVDAYIGAVFAFVIAKSGFEALKSTISELVGRAGSEDLAKALYREIRSTEGIISAADMMLHNYGPDRYSGSVNVEIDHNANIGEIYEKLHALQLKIMHEQHVTMVFGIYAVDNDSPVVKELRRYIAAFVRSQPHIKSYHALYVSEATSTIYVDFMADYQLHDWDSVRSEFLQYMSEGYPAYGIELTIETDFV